MKEIHVLQMNILRKLLFAKSLRYSEIKQENIENSQFVFHLDRLISSGFIEKGNDGYFLTISGKEFANRMDSEEIKMRSFPKTTTVLCCVRNKDKEYLIYKRLKNPFFGGQGFPTQKVWFGDGIEDTACKGLKEETNLEGEPELFAIRHYHVFTKENELVEDKIMYMFRFINPTSLLKGNDEGEFEWVEEGKIGKCILNPLPEFEETFELLKNYSGQISFKEVSLFTNKF